MLVKDSLRVLGIALLELMAVFVANVTLVQAGVARATIPRCGTEALKWECKTGADRVFIFTNTVELGCLTIAGQRAHLLVLERHGDKKALLLLLWLFELVLATRWRSVQRRILLLLYIIETVFTCWQSFILLQVRRIALVLRGLIGVLSR